MILLILVYTLKNCKCLRLEQNQILILLVTFFALRFALRVLLSKYRSNGIILA